MNTPEFTFAMFSEAGARINGTSIYLDQQGAEVEVSVAGFKDEAEARANYLFPDAVSVGFVGKFVRQARRGSFPSFADRKSGRRLLLE